MLTFRDVEPGILECTLDLGRLYPDHHAREQFEARWEQFLASDPVHQSLFSRRAGTELVYLTEQFIAEQQDSRPPVLLLLGNPASHSVLARMCFSYEGKGREHRFWAALRQAGLLQFRSDESGRALAWRERNELRKADLHSLHYTSPFRIGIAVHFSMPSSASDPRWSGVAGLQRLLGSGALRSITLEESMRLARLIRQFIGTRGGVIAFQKDAYEGMRTGESPPYSADLARHAGLLGFCRYGPHILLAGAPPTRLLRSQDCQESLAQCKGYLVAGLLGMDSEGGSR